MSKKRLMAVASTGGHWVQLNRLAPAFENCNVMWVSTAQGMADKVPFGAYRRVRDASMWDKPGLAVMAFQVFWATLRFRPQVVITTGAAPGFFAMVFGKLMGAQTIWLDSIANGEEMSLSGAKARRWADHWLTQWPELARPEGPEYIGAVL